MYYYLWKEDVQEENTTQPAWKQDVESETPTQPPWKEDVEDDTATKPPWKHMHQDDDKRRCKKNVAENLEEIPCGEPEEDVEDK